MDQCIDEILGSRNLREILNLAKAEYQPNFERERPRPSPEDAEYLASVMNTGPYANWVEKKEQKLCWLWYQTDNELVDDSAVLRILRYQIHDDLRSYYIIYVKCDECQRISCYRSKRPRSNLRAVIRSLIAQCWNDFGEMYETLRPYREIVRNLFQDTLILDPIGERLAGDNMGLGDADTRAIVTLMELLQRMTQRLTALLNKSLILAFDQFQCIEPGSIEAFVAALEQWSIISVLDYRSKIIMSSLPTMKLAKLLHPSDERTLLIRQQMDKHTEFEGENNLKVQL